MEHNIDRAHFKDETGKIFTAIFSWANGKFMVAVTLQRASENN